MDIRKLQYFVAVVDEGSITKAAKKLHMSQPPLSTQMKLLEEELDIVLFDRGSRNIQLTEAGRLLYNRAQSILALSDATVQELKDFGNGLKGILRIGVISSAATGTICLRMKEFSLKYPNITFEISEGNTYELLDQLNQGSIETALVRTPFPQEGLECRFLEREPMMAVGDRRFFGKEDGENISILDLDGKPLILYRRWEAAITEAFQEKGIDLQIFCKNDDARTTAIWADAGLGVGIMPQNAVFRSWAPGIVKKVIESEKLYTQMAVVHRRDRYISSIAQRFIEEF